MIDYHNLILFSHRYIHNRVSDYLGGSVVLMVRLRPIASFTLCLSAIGNIGSGSTLFTERGFGTRWKVSRNAGISKSETQLIKRVLEELGLKS